METPIVATVSHDDMLKELAASRRKKKESVKRECLRCDKKFDSFSKCERVCYKCKHRGDWDDAASFTWAQRGGL